MEFIVMGAAFLISALVSFACKPKTAKPKPQAFNKGSFPLCEDGTTKSVGFGQVKTADFTLIAASNFRTKAIRSKGGKK